MAATRRVDFATTFTKSPATWLLIIVNVALYLVVSAQGGTLRAFNNPDGGARFEIAFPKLVV